MENVEQNYIQAYLGHPFQLDFDKGFLFYKYGSKSLTYSLNKQRLSGNTLEQVLTMLHELWHGVK